VHTEPPPQPASVDPNPGEPVPAPAPEPVPPAPESTVPPPELVPQGRKRRAAAKPARESPESPGPKERPFADEERAQEAAQPRSWWSKILRQLKSLELSRRRYRFCSLDVVADNVRRETGRTCRRGQSWQRRREFLDILLDHHEPTYDLFAALLIPGCSSAQSTSTRIRIPHS
jgi:hypothetical protein